MTSSVVIITLNLHEYYNIDARQLPFESDGKHSTSTHRTLKLYFVQAYDTFHACCIYLIKDPVRDSICMYIGFKTSFYVSRFSSMCVLFLSGWWGSGPSTQPQTRRTSVSLCVWVLSFDLFGKGGHTSSYATAGIDSTGFKYKWELYFSSLLLSVFESFINPPAYIFQDNCHLV